jgi:hypothetical protein
MWPTSCAALAEGRAFRAGTPLLFSAGAACWQVHAYGPVGDQQCTSRFLSTLY